MTPATANILKATLKGDNEVTGAQLNQVLGILKGRPSAGPETVPQLAVNQARVCEMLDCSRFHVRKLVKLGHLPQRDIAGLKRYAVADVMKLLGGDND